MVAVREKQKTGPSAFFKGRVNWHGGSRYFAEGNPILQAIFLCHWPKFISLMVVSTLILLDRVWSTSVWAKEYSQHRQTG
jgi:hypothetical protein